jgi:hypothetical protein
MTETNTVVAAIEAVIEELASATHRELATELVRRLGEADPDQQLEALRRLIRDMVRDLDVVAEEEEDS